MSDVPDGWIEKEWIVGDADQYDEVSGEWVSDDEEIEITARHEVSEGGHVSYPIIVNQKVGNDEYETWVETHSTSASNAERARDAAIEFMREVNDGQHKIRLLSCETWREYVQFYTISDSDLPDDLTADMLIESINSDDFDSDIDMDEADAEDLDVTVDIYLRHESEAELQETT